jgi:hypothetical protein
MLEKITLRGDEYFPLLRKREIPHNGMMFLDSETPQLISVSD